MGRRCCIDVLRRVVSRRMRGQAIGKNTTRCNVCFYDQQNKGGHHWFLVKVEQLHRTKPVLRKASNLIRGQILLKASRSAQG
jgi:hypothetical protein